jgi:hypothetical protein
MRQIRLLASVAIFASEAQSGVLTLKNAPAFLHGCHEWQLTATTKETPKCLSFSDTGK